MLIVFVLPEGSCAVGNLEMFDSFGSLGVMGRQDTQRCAEGKKA